MIGDPACVVLVLGEEPGGGQQRQVLQPGELPDLLDVADLLLRAVVDTERVLIRADRRPVTGSRNQSGSSRSVRITPRVSHSPRSSRSAAASTSFLASSGTRAAVPGGNTAVNASSRASAAARPGQLLAGHLPRRPGRADHLVPDPPGHLDGRHLGRPADIPAEP